MDKHGYWIPALALASGVALLTAQAAELASVTIEKPRLVTVKGGGCRILSNGAFSGTWGPSSLPTLAFTIGPTPMTDYTHANAAKFSGPGKYANEIIAVYLGKTATQEAFGGLGTVVINADGRTGSFTVNDGSASGRFDCGAPPVR